MSFRYDRNQIEIALKKAMFGRNNFPTECTNLRQFLGYVNSFANFCTKIVDNYRKKSKSFWFKFDFNPHHNPASDIKIIASLETNGVIISQAAMKVQSDSNTAYTFLKTTIQQLVKEIVDYLDNEVSQNMTLGKIILNEIGL